MPWTRPSTQTRRRPLEKWWIMCCGRWRQTGSRQHSSSSKVTCGGRRMLQGESKASKYTDRFSATSEFIHSHGRCVFKSSNDCEVSINTSNDAPIRAACSTTSITIVITLGARKLENTMTQMLTVFSYCKSELLQATVMNCLCYI